MLFVSLAAAHIACNAVDPIQKLFQYKMHIYDGRFKKSEGERGCHNLE